MPDILLQNTLTGELLDQFVIKGKVGRIEQLRIRLAQEGHKVIDPLFGQSIVLIRWCQSQNIELTVRDSILPNTFTPSRIAPHKWHRVVVRVDARDQVTRRTPTGHASLLGRQGRQIVVEGVALQNIGGRWVCGWNDARLERIGVLHGTLDPHEDANEGDGEDELKKRRYPPPLAIDEIAAAERPERPREAHCYGVSESSLR
mmetsp:Transcript_22824/g.65838  ORF Transcript_22824/g.65838 Transcript_22824/m.65838 type:complete len:202 (+) Transcript_22824:3660-4265(+)